MNKEEFKRMRLELGVSQTELAKIVDKHSLTISKIERGLLKPFDLRRYLEGLIWRGNVAFDWLEQLNKSAGD